MGVLTALLCLLRCATVLLDITSLQNVGEQLTQQHTKSSLKTGIFTLNTFDDYEGVSKSPRTMLITRK
jgi:hypothetical protein